MPTAASIPNAGERVGSGSGKKSGTDGSHGWVPPTPEEVGALIPNYEVLAILGRGGMGAVYKARQITLDRPVALKLLPLEVSVDDNFANRFRREARALAKLNHPHIIAIHDFGQTREGQLYFAMEFVEGANLAEVIRQVGLNPEQALSLAGQICAALAYAHGKGVVHRDIKPANVMIDMDSHAKVADFGLARLIERNAEASGYTMTGTVMGTPGYMAPEQMLDMNVDHRADIYSLGVMLYEMLCGETPQGAFTPPSQRIGCDVRIDQIVLKAMQQAPDRRYQSTEEMEAAVESARFPAPEPEAVPLHVQVRAHHMATHHAKPKKSHGVTIAAVVAVVALAAIFLAKPWATDAKLTAKPLATSDSRESAPPEPQPSSSAMSKPAEPVPQQTVEDSIKRLMATKGWEEAKISVTPEGTLAVDLNERNIDDLTPLVGLPVSELNARGTPITDLGPLRGLSLHGLYLVNTPVSDLSPLKDLPLLNLGLANTRVTDLSALRDMKLRTLCLDRNSQEIDLAPLAGMTTLEDVLLPENPKNLELLRKLTNLKYIGYTWSGELGKGSATPASEFWKSHAQQKSAGTSQPSVDTTSSGGSPKSQSATGRWLAEQDLQWQATFANEVGTPFESGAGSLKKKYLAALDLQVEAATRSGRLDDVTALRAEINRLSSGGEVPVEDDATTAATLKTLRATYRKAFAPLYADRMAAAKVVYGRYDAILAKYLLGITQRQRLDEAAEIKAKRERLGAAWLRSPCAIIGNTFTAATKERPFVNSLGMKFVPVRMSGGASGGQRVLFSIFETQVQDYEVFATETKRRWTKPGFPQDPTHPAVNIGQADVQAFAAWLTERERKAGWLRSNDSYRLPTDHEWSCAAGIGEQEIEGKSPGEKDLTIAKEFPWGSRWPPVAGTGNFSGEEAAGHEVWNGQTILAGYRDDFPETAPVGIYAANSFGLFDLGGNVWEFCDTREKSVRRGGAFGSATERDLNSTRRLLNDPEFLDNTTGFRLVLVSKTSAK
ncbi:MAG: protein kinase [Verrucomicrobiota bacterium]